MAELLVDSDSASVVSTDLCSPSTSGGELNVSFSDLVCLEDSQEDGDTSKVCVNYQEFFDFPDSRPRSKLKCIARFIPWEAIRSKAFSVVYLA